ncbi:Uncharacterised protein [Mycobacteroides abscessus subsp. bolletii]|uniref:hypothetical protein n=1 Tax=Mycobacteroides abscessus TaxID=36809 RepID=UPI0009A7E5FC|nr:hypothetical protein [Mycobacteroides abscessus]SKY22237.1 Uncharacterised protein [Mycobacteroides abscessus subsp. bolletii]
MSEDKPTDLGSASAHAEALALSHRATEQRRRCTELSGENKGKTINKACERLIAQAQANEQKADRLNLVSEALKTREEAARIWNRNAPRDSELADARKAMGAASEELKRAEGVAVIAADAKMKAAIQHSADLNERRKQADEDYERAEKRARAKLAEVKLKGDKKGDVLRGGSTSMDLPGDGKPGTPSAHALAKGVPGHSKGSATAAKPAGAAPAPSAAPSSASTGGAPIQEKALSDLLRQTGQLPAGQPQQQAPGQPQVAPAAAAASPAAASSARTDGRRADEPLKSSDFPDMPVPFGMPSSPGLTAVTTASGPPTAHPSAPSGSSAAGLQTDSNVSGRPDALRGAFSPSTSASGAAGATSAGTGLNPKGMQAAGQPMAAPMGGLPMTGGGAGSGVGKDRSQIHTANQREWGEGVVRGGTIAQNRPDYEEDDKKGP